MSCLKVSKQRVIDKYVVGYGTEYQFKLSVTPYGYPLTPDLAVVVNGIEVKNSSVQVNGYSFVTVNNRIYVDLTSYLTSLLSVVQTQAPAVELQTYSHELLDPESSGFSEIPQQLEANPTQLEVFEISGSDLTQHFVSIISNQEDFAGVAFGGTNNYRDTRKNRSFGNYILQNVAPVLKTMLVSSSDELDFIDAVRFSQDEYTKFKNRYLRTALQLINQEFNPVQYQNNTVVVSTWVDEILKTINVSKEFSNSFAYSYMIANGSPYATEVATVPVDGLVILTEYIDLSDPRNALYVYNTTGLEQLLVIGEDYEIASSNLSIEIQINLSSLSVAPGDNITVVLYKNPLPAYIPSTPSKVGTYPTFVPRKELDETYVSPTYVIIGHDGSKTIAYNDYRDELLLELEKRIYNLIQYKFRHEYYLPIRVESVKSGYFRETRYSREEYLDITESYLNKWSAKNRANYRVNDWASASLEPSVIPDPYAGNIWKLYNYRDAVDVSAQALDLPGNWKGIFQYYYDTYNPDTRPWEMLGFSSKPTWWEFEYGAPVLNGAGQEVWTSTAAGNNDMWADLEAGIIRQGPSAIYSPITELVQPQEMWARPGLSSIIPVDAAGEIISVMTLFNVAYSGNPYAPFDYFEIDWVYGDGAPVEQAWMSSSAYAYSVQEFLYLMKPAQFGELFWDTVGTELSPGMITVPTSDEPVMTNQNWQFVQNDTFSSDDPFFEWMRPKNKNQVVHAEIIDGVTQIRFGYQRWISDRILFLGTDITAVFGHKIRTLDVNLANKLAGFTNKDTTNTYIESVSPNSSTSSLIIPSTNFDVLLHKSPAVDTYSYSGVIIRALADGTFVVYGYDLLSSEFITLDRTTDKLIDVSVGGTPAPFVYFTSGATYAAGDIVRYNGVYYVSLTTQTVQRFDESGFQRLKLLPTVGGISVTYKPVSATTITKVPYGSVFRTAQQVFDFLISWGAYLESKGWKFDEVSTDTNQLNDWLTSAKQFLFWLNTEWAPDAAIQLSPLANKATLEVSRGYPDDVETMSNGVYSILDKFGVAIAPDNTTTDRDGRVITVEPSSVATGGIYYLQVNTSETEHVLIFDNTTNFNDVVYAPLLRARQQRLRFNGFRSNGWYGKMEAPGYLIIDNQLVPNYDTIVESMRYFYDPNVTIDNPSLEDLGRHLIGYESKSYLDNLQLSNDVQYLFYQGAIRQKGTSESFEKLFRSTKVQSDEIIEVYEEWALKLGDFGNTVEQVSTEFILTPEQNTGEVIVARLNFIPSKIGSIRQIKILNAENTYTIVPAIVISPPDADPTDPDLTEPLRQAKAYAVLDSAGRIARVDVTDPGYGYLEAARISLNAGTQAIDLDRFYSVWQGYAKKDVTLENIVNIDIDQTDKWTVRPNDPAYSLEFPVTERIDYPLPNAGYVHFNDVDLYSFDVLQTVLNWGTDGFNPVEGNTIWIAKTFTEDWDVYKMIDVTAASEFEVIADENNDLYLRTPLSYELTPQLSFGTNETDFGNMIALQVIEAQAEAVIDSGNVTEIIITKTGVNYISVPEITITGDGIGATAIAEIAGGVVSNIIITNPGTGYTFASINISPPLTVSPDTNYTVGFGFSYADATYNYYSLLTLDALPITSQEIPDYANFTKLMLFKGMRFMTSAEPILETYVEVGDKVWIDNIGVLPSLWSVYKRVNITPENLLGLELYRQQGPLINTSLFESASVFAINTDNKLVLLPVYDPFKNILPGPAKQNISYISMQDPARYNVTANDRLFSENITFARRQVGRLWWDLSSTRYVYYEQPKALDGSETDTDNLVYRRDHWGQIFPGSTVDIYEWVESDVIPAEYTGTGTPRDTTSYVQIDISNRFTNITETKYYFWVQNTTDLPNVENRTMAALSVSSLLQAPKSQGFVFFSPIQQTRENNSYMFYNVQEILAYQGDNVQIQYRLAEREDQEHTQWSFFREGDSNSVVTDQYWNKMVDSLCAYTKPLPISDEYNGIPVGPRHPWEIFPWDSTPWDMTIIGEVLPVPDPTLSEKEKFGIEYRPRQGMFVKLASARKVFVQAANELLQYIAIRDDNPGWNADVDTDIYWTYTNWYRLGYEGVVPTIVFSTLADATIALTAGQLNVGTILQVTDGTIDGRFVLYAVVQVNPNISTLSLEEVCIENSAIKLLDTIYTVSNIFGLSTELRQLLNAFRTQVMVDEFKVDQNELFFSMLNYVVSEQKNPDWVFKSSYIYVKENNLPLSQDQLYIPNQIENVIDYITDVKPYHTQIRDYTSTYVTSDLAEGTAFDTYKINTVLTFGPDNTDYTDPGHWDASCGSTGDIPLNEWGDEVWGELLWNDPSLLNNDPLPWDSFAWDVCPPISYIVDALTFSENPEQFISREDVYTVQLDFFDASKVGLSELFPYTFNILTLNGPQLFVPPENIVGVQIGTAVLIYGRDYYAEYNSSDETYTVYFYNDPTVYLPEIPVALVWFNGGGMQHFRYNTVRNEVAHGFARDNLVINTDTKLPVNDVSAEILGNEPATFTAPYAPLVGWGDSWDGFTNPAVEQIISDAGGTTSILWDVPIIPVLFENAISSKENTTRDSGSYFYRNAERLSGELLVDLPSPTADTEYLDIITVYVNPLINPTTDILPDPTPSTPGVVWIEGERIEYKMKVEIAPNTWELKLVRRGTIGTSPTSHAAMIPSLANPLVLVPNPVWVERGNYMPINSGTVVWNVLAAPASPDISSEGPPAEFSNVSGVPLGGLWYSQTDQANFLKQSQGKSIP